MKLQPTDFMIGDWVLVEGTPEQITGVDKKYVHLEGNACERFHEGLIESIPLTKEILEKNNFMRHEVWDDTYVLDKDKEICTDCEEIGISSRNIAGDWEWHSIGSCKYVHELQHVLKVCGIKKEIEL